jgi:hypothetical protein
MKSVHQNWNQLGSDCLQIAFVCGTIGIALKFLTFFNHWVYFPTFPNVLDSAFLITSILYFAYAARKRIHKNQMYTKQYSSIQMQANIDIQEPDSLEEELTAK